MAIPIIFLSLLLFIKALDTNKKSYYITEALVLAVLSLIHPLSTVFVFLTITSYLIINYKETLKKINNLLIIFLIPIIVLTLLLFTDINGKSNLIEFLKNFLVFRHGWGIFEKSYSIPQFYGYALLVLAIMGIYSSLKNKRQTILVHAAIITSLLLLMFAIYRFTVFIPYQRVVYYFAISLVLLSAIGLYNTARQFTNKKAIILLAIGIVLAISFIGYKNVPIGVEPYHIINPEEYEALKFLSQISTDQVVLANSLKSATIYPLTHNYAAVLAQGSMLGREIKKFNNYPAKDCKEKYSAAREYEINYVLIENKIECEGFLEIYNKGIYLYKIIPLN